mgnify:CR=1 FL=1
MHLKCSYKITATLGIFLVENVFYKIQGKFEYVFFFCFNSIGILVFKDSYNMVDVFGLL